MMRGTSVNDPASSSSSINNVQDGRRSSLKRSLGLMTDSEKHMKLNEESEESHVKVCAYNKHWHLPRQILRLIPYFSEKYPDLYNASGHLVIELGIENPNVTLEGLDFFFNYLYSVKYPLKSQDVFPILEVAMFFQHQHLIKTCVERIKEKSMDLKTAITLCNIADAYNYETTRITAKECLEMTLFTTNVEDIALAVLRNISPKLMGELVASPDLISDGGEYNIYKMLKKWLYSKLNNKGIGFEKFYEKTGWQVPFLETEEGKVYEEPFKALKMLNLLMTYTDEDKLGSIDKLIETDKILPETWMLKASRKFLHIMHQMKNHTYVGPTEVNEQQFEKEALRFCSLITKREKTAGWFEEDFLFGLNLYFEATGNKFSVMRTNNLLKDTYKKERPMGLSNSHPTYNILIKVDYKVVDERGNVTRVESSGIQKLSLTLDKMSEISIMDEDPQSKIYVLVRMLAHIP